MPVKPDRGNDENYTPTGMQGSVDSLRRVTVKPDHQRVEYSFSENGSIPSAARVSTKDWYVLRTPDDCHGSY